MSVKVGHICTLIWVADISSANILHHGSLSGDMDGMWATSPCFSLCIFASNSKFNLQ